MKYYFFPIIGIGLCLLLLQLEIAMLMAVAASNLRIWDSQVSFNQSVIDGYECVD